MSGAVLRILQRRRVTLGFAVAVGVLAFAHPTEMSLIAGTLIASLGEGLRLWAAGHLEKSREITKSGPYRFSRHPLYVGSSVMGMGFAVASHSLIAAALIALYLATTLTAAIRGEEAFLRRRFGAEYDAYARGTAAGAIRQFSLARARRNREDRSVVGLCLVIGLLALKLVW